MTAQEVTQAIYQRVADKMVAMLDENIVPWQQPWHGGATGAISHMTGRPYSLLNQYLCEFREGEYVTFNQARKLGGNVKRGAKGYLIVFFEPKQKEVTRENGDTDIEYYFILKNYTVFNIADCEGLQPRWTEKCRAMIPDPIAEAEQVAADYIAREKINFMPSLSAHAYYRESDDAVVVPELSQYDNAAGYYAVLFHELAHSTGSARRLDRFKNSGATAALGDGYSREELVAEMSSAYALARLQIDTERTFENSAAYIREWRKFIKNEPRAVVIAATQAEKAVNYIFGTQR
jgi:antirestriction protein ArdC